MDTGDLKKRILSLQKSGELALSSEDKTLLKNLNKLKERAESKSAKTKKKSIPFHSSLSL
jgi:hypothetical protein